MEQRITLKDYAMRFGQTKTAKDSRRISKRDQQGHSCRPKDFFNYKR